MSFLSSLLHPRSNIHLEDGLAQLYALKPTNKPQNHLLMVSLAEDKIIRALKRGADPDRLVDHKKIALHSHTPTALNVALYCHNADVCLSLVEHGVDFMCCDGLTLWAEQLKSIDQTFGDTPHPQDQAEIVDRFLSVGQAMCRKNASMNGGEGCDLLGNRCVLALVYFGGDTL